jgi:hypothetical protein
MRLISLERLLVAKLGPFHFIFNISDIFSFIFEVPINVFKMKPTVMASSQSRKEHTGGAFNSFAQ